MDAVKVEGYTLFVDAQNIYKSARHTFFSEDDSSIYGQIDFVKLAKLIEERCPVPNIKRHLNEIRIYTGQPSSRRAPYAYSAFINQKEAWEKAGMKVIARPLRYLPVKPNKSDEKPEKVEIKPQQKGVDVQIALDLVIYAIDQKYDIGILASADTDLKPAMDLVKSRCGDKCKVEVVGIKGNDNDHKRALYSPDIHCYWISRSDYDQIADLTSYSGKEIHSQLKLDITPP